MHHHQQSCNAYSIKVFEHSSWVSCISWSRTRISGIFSLELCRECNWVFRTINFRQHKGFEKMRYLFPKPLGPEQVGVALEDTDNVIVVNLRQHPLLFAPYAWSKRPCGLPHPRVEQAPPVCAIELLQSLHVVLHVQQSSGFAPVDDFIKRVLLVWNLTRGEWDVLGRESRGRTQQAMAACFIFDIFISMPLLGAWGQWWRRRRRWICCYYCLQCHRLRHHREVHICESISRAGRRSLDSAILGGYQYPHSGGSGKLHVLWYSSIVM